MLVNSDTSGMDSHSFSVSTGSIVGVSCVSGWMYTLTPSTSSAFRFSLKLASWYLPFIVFKKLRKSMMLFCYSAFGRHDCSSFTYCENTDIATISQHVKDGRWLPGRTFNLRASGLSRRQYPIFGELMGDAANAHIQFDKHLKN